MPSNFQILGNSLFSHDVVIASGASSSEPFSLQGKALIAIIMPAAWTAASLGFAGCMSGRIADMQQIFDKSGAAESAVAAANKPIALPNSDPLFFPFMQVLSVQVADKVTLVNQAADRTLTLIYRNYQS